MTATAVLIGLAAYFAGAAYCITRVSRRVDAVFVRDMTRVLRSRGGVGSEAAGGARPRPLPATAGVELAPPPAPPATQALAGAVYPQTAAPARLHRVRVGGAL